MGAGIALQRMGHHREAIECFVHVLSKLIYLIEAFRRMESNLRDTKQIQLFDIYKNAQINKFSKMIILTFMNLSRTLELDNRFYHGEVAARIALYNTVDL